MTSIFLHVTLVVTLGVLSLAETNVIHTAAPSKDISEKSDLDLKTDASERFFDLGYKYNTPAAVYGAPGSGYYPSSGYNTGYAGSGYTSPGYSGYSGYLGNSGYSGYSGSNILGGGYSSLGGGYSSLGGGYSSLGGGYNSLGGYNRGHYSGYQGNGGYGGYFGNGGLSSYSGYNSPYYTGQGNLGYGYYNRGGVGFNRGLTGYGGVTPSYVSGYRGYS